MAQTDLFKRSKADELDAAQRWLTAGNGSARLRKAANLGLLEQSLTVYREERLATELGREWRFLRSAARLEDAVNPTEADLDRLAKARQTWDTVTIELRFMLQPHRCPNCTGAPCRDYDYRGPALVATYLDRQVFIALRKMGAPL